jgi:hypothetical protein
MAETIFELFRSYDLETGFRPQFFASKRRQTHAWVLGPDGPERQDLDKSHIISVPPCRVLFGDLGRLLAAAADEYGSVPLGEVDMEFAYHNIPLAGVVSHLSHAGVPAGFFAVAAREDFGVIIRQEDFAWAYVNPLAVRRVRGVFSV